MYCALGFEFKTELTSLLAEHPQDNILTLPITKRREWVAVESLPTGGLMEATMAWAASTQNLYWAYEPASFHPSDFMNQVVGCLEKRGLKFPIKFFDHLRARILAKSKELSDEECLELYKGCYLEAGEKSISSTAITEFEIRLRQVIEDRREKYLTHNSNLSMA